MTHAAEGSINLECFSLLKLTLNCSLQIVSLPQKWPTKLSERKSSFILATLQGRHSICIWRQLYLGFKAEGPWSGNSHTAGKDLGGVTFHAWRMVSQSWCWGPGVLQPALVINCSLDACKVSFSQLSHVSSLISVIKSEILSHRKQF